MTYWKALCLMRAKNLTPIQQIERNMTLAAGNVVIAVGAYIALMGIKVYVALHPRPWTVIDIHQSPPFWKDRP